MNYGPLVGVGDPNGCDGRVPHALPVHPQFDLVDGVVHRVAEAPAAPPPRLLRVPHPRRRYTLQQEGPVVAVGADLLPDREVDAEVLCHPLEEGFEAGPPMELEALSTCAPGGVEVEHEPDALHAFRVLPHIGAAAEEADLLRGEEDESEPTIDVLLHLGEDAGHLHDADSAGRVVQRALGYVVSVVVGAVDDEFFAVS